jgi:hypothetical protein
MYTIFHERQNRARTYYEKHFAWKVLSCLYCETHIPFGPYGEGLVHVADCPSCTTAYEIALEDRATRYGIEAVSYRSGSGREPLPVPEDRSMPIINPMVSTSDTFADDLTQASTTFFYPLDLFMPYVNEGHEGVELRERTEKRLEKERAAVQQLFAAMLSAPLSGWQTFADPLGFFTVRFPPDWTVEGGWSDDPRNRLHTSSSIMEGFHFYFDHPHGSGRPVPDGSGIRVIDLFIGAEPITTDEYQEYASQPSFKGSTFHGHPAAVYTFHGYQINVATPAAFFRLSSRPDMPRLEGDIKRVVDRILDSFQLVAKELSW